MSAQPHAGLVEHHAEAVEVRLHGVGALRRDVPVRAHVGPRLGLLHDEADVGQLGLPAHEHDVGRLDVAVDQAGPVQPAQGCGQAPAQLHHGLHVQPAALGHHAAQRARTIGPGVDAGGGPGVEVVRQLHHVVEVALGVVPTGVEHVHEPVVLAGQGLEALNPGKLPVVGPLIPKQPAPDHLHRPPNTQHGPREPDLPMAALADAVPYLVVRHHRHRATHVSLNCAHESPLQPRPTLPTPAPPRTRPPRGFSPPPSATAPANGAARRTPSPG